MKIHLRFIAPLLFVAQAHAAFEMVLMPLVSQWAVLGGIPITQEKLPFTVTKPGKYIIIEPLSSENKSEPAITVATSDATIDLNGFTLDCSDGIRGIHVNAGLSNIVIQHGSVNRAHECGILFEKQCHDIRLQDLMVLNCGTVGLFMAECSNVCIRDSIFNGNGAQTNGQPMVTDAHLIQTFSNLVYSTAHQGAINDRGWYTLLQMQQQISAGVYIRGTPDQRCSNIQCHSCMFNENYGRQTVAGLVIAFADAVHIEQSQCMSNQVTTSGAVSRNAGALLAAVCEATVERCHFAENISAGDGVPSGLCLQGFAIHDDIYNLRCFGIRISDCTAHNNHRALAGAPALNIHGSNFDKVWSDGVTLINCQSSHAARLYQVQECCNVSYLGCDAMGGVASDIPWQIDNGFRGFANHQSANILHEQCRVFNLDQNNEHPASFQGVEGFYAAIEDVVTIDGTKRIGVGMSSSPFDIYMTVTPLNGLVYRNCIVSHAIDRSAHNSNAFGITIRGGQGCFIEHCVINSVQHLQPADLIFCGTGIALEDALLTSEGTGIIGGQRFNQDNWVVGNKVFGCQTGIADISLATTTTARCAYLENKVFKATFPYHFSDDLTAATPIVIWPLSAGKQPPAVDSTGNPPTQWTNLAIK